ncbi:recombinase family protein [Pelotomaculum terephthalicicum JT]|uniref:recombinase family protein n=1 Tax=Pelotomaculum terephthalicicum TaxID=206393 RepID=UPI001F042421|nr:recombinase family protein [Pelotomaculum terephthalicicum]MCG9967448.1 recombinase family protein [Pelotomaculum terephthalicicum JT]
MKATIYARFSSDNQREESITAQVRACTEYAQKQGYTIVKVYTDEAKSATTDDRPGFMQMISDIKTNRLQVDVLLIHKLDRFARNRYDSAFYKRELKRAEVRVESVLEHLDDSPESILMESIFEGMAEYYSKNLAREVMKGMKETALQGKHTGGLAPLGLSVDKEGYYIINKLEAEAIRIIFNMFHQGHGYSNIQGELNKKGLKTKLGRPFSKNSIHDILRNKKYAGIYVFNRASSKSPDGRRNNHKSKSREEVIEIKGAIPAIIPSEIFWEVQAKMDKNQRQNSKGSYKSKTVYILSGVIWCGECGKRMVGTSSSYLTRVSREHRKQYYYECNYGKRTGACGNGKIRKDLAENYVLSELEARLLNDLAIPELAHKISIHYKQEKMKSAGEGLFLEQELLKVDKQINNLVQAITEGGATVRVIVEQLKRLEAKKSSLESRLQEWRIKQSQDLLSENTIASYLQHYRELLKSDDPVSCKQLVEEFVERVTINKDTIKVTFKVSVDTSA